MATSRRPLAPIMGLSMTAQAQLRADGLLVTVNSAVRLTLSTNHDPGTYYRTRRGLYVWDGFRHRVVAKASPTAAGTPFVVNVHKLTGEATDAEIEASLPENHFFDESAVCAIVAEMIRKQPSGKPGDLVKSGRANLLYTRSCVVFVRWVGLRRKWCVLASGRGGSWDAGSRVFSPAN